MAMLKTESVESCAYIRWAMDPLRSNSIIGYIITVLKKEDQKAHLSGIPNGLLGEIMK
jgi:hypothetical protein